MYIYVADHFRQLRAYRMARRADKYLVWAPRLFAYDKALRVVVPDRPGLSRDSGSDHDLVSLLNAFHLV